MSDGYLLEEAKARLAACPPDCLEEARRLTDEYNLPDEAELGLRLLSPEQLNEFSAREEELQRSLSKVAEEFYGKVVLQLIGRLDPAVSRMVRGLLQLDAEGVEPRPPVAKVAKVPHPPKGPPSAKALAARGLRSPAGPPAKAVAVSSAKPAVLQEAEVRIAVSRQNPKHMMMLKEWQAELSLCDETVLSMKLLAPDHIDELHAGKDDILEKLSAGEKTADEVILWLISMLDPAIPDLVAQISQMDSDAGSSMSSTARAPSYNSSAAEVSSSSSATTALPAAGSVLWRGLLQQIYIKYNPAQLKNLDGILAKYKHCETDLYEALSEKYHFPLGAFGTPKPAGSVAAKIASNPKPVGSVLGKIASSPKPVGSVLAKIASKPEPKLGSKPLVAKASAPAQQHETDETEALVEAATKRLEANKKVGSSNQAAVQKLCANNNFADEVVLALRLLPNVKLIQLASRSASLQQQLADAPDKNHCMMSMVAAIDPQVQEMVRKLKELDGKANSDASSPRSRGSSVAAASQQSLRAGQAVTRQFPKAGPKAPGVTQRGLNHFQAAAPRAANTAEVDRSRTPPPRGFLAQNFASPAAAGSITPRGSISRLVPQSVPKQSAARVSNLPLRGSVMKSSR
jgi:hypothetical protein